MSYMSRKKQEAAGITQKIANMEEKMLAISAANSLLSEKTETLADNIQNGNLEQGELLPDGDISPEEWSKRFLAANEVNIGQISVDDLLSEEQLSEIEREFERPLYERLEDAYNRKYGCDKIDYAAAAISGVITGLIDALFVGMPHSSLLGNFTDDLADKSVMKFAKLCGWKGPKKGKTSPIASAIGYLERGGNVKQGQEASSFGKILSKIGLITTDKDTGKKVFGGFKVNYDQRLQSEVPFDMRPGIHHFLSLAHSPSLVGLICSIINQFTLTSTFIAEGKLITIDADDGKFQLYGKNIYAKIFAGFVNWFGHLMSDIAGSSGGRGHNTGKGSGIPIPFSELILFLNIGSFGNDRRTIAELAVKMFESGYDLRHGAAMSIPVIINELLIRFFWMLKRHYKHNMSWRESLPTTNNPSVNRMLLVGHGCLCLVDAADAGIRCGGILLTFLLRLNLIAWARLGFAGLKEINHLANKKTCMLHMEGERLDRLIEDADYILKSVNDQ